MHHRNGYFFFFFWRLIKRIYLKQGEFFFFQISNSWIFFFKSIRVNAKEETYFENEGDKFNRSTSLEFYDSYVIWKLYTCCTLCISFDPRLYFRKFNASEIYKSCVCLFRNPWWNFKNVLPIVVSQKGKESGYISQKVCWKNTSGC